MDLPERGEPFAVVTDEEAVGVLVGIEAEELPDDLDGEDLGIRELRCRSATSEVSPFETVVDEAENGHDDGVTAQIKTVEPKHSIRNVQRNVLRLGW